MFYINFVSCKFTKFIYSNSFWGGVFRIFYIKDYVISKQRQFWFFFFNLDVFYVFDFFFFFSGKNFLCTILKTFSYKFVIILKKTTALFWKTNNDKVDNLLRCLKYFGLESGPIFYRQKKKFICQCISKWCLHWGQLTLMRRKYKSQWKSFYYNF